MNNYKINILISEKNFDSSSIQNNFILWRPLVRPFLGCTLETQFHKEGLRTRGLWELIV